MPNPEDSIFNEALGRPTPTERAAYLDSACAGDAALRQRVEGLLLAHTQAGGFLSGPPITDLDATRATAAPTDETLAAAPAPAATDETMASTGGASRPPTATVKLGPQPVFTAPRSEQTGDSIGRYQLVSVLGEGGMGTVFLAEQSEPVKRRVALKIIKLGMDTKSVVARFEAERQALALMDHPSIAKVFDAGATENGRPFFVMELVEGVPITKYCDDHRLDTKARVRLFIQVCHALQHAHQKGIIHRDLKPSNILVAQVDGKPVPKVIDFGVAKATGRQLSDATLTEANAFLGTPSYASPEQAGALPDVDTRSDVYTLGVILYELLTGRLPLDPAALRRAALEEILRLIREEDPPKPSTRVAAFQAGDRTTLDFRLATNARQLAGELRGDLDWVVMKALEKDRDRRYESASGLAMDLDRHLNHEPVSAIAPNALYVFQKYARRHRVLISAAAAVLVSILAGLGVSTHLFFKERVARREANRRLEQTERANEILGSVFDGLNPRLLKQDGKPVQAIIGDRLDKAAAMLDGEAIGDPLMTARMQLRLGISQLALGNFSSSAGVLAKALATFERFLGPEHPLTINALNSLAAAFRGTGEYHRAIPLLEQARKAAAAKFGSAHPETVETLNNLAFAYEETGQTSRALALYNETVRLTQPTTGTNSAAEALRNRANSLRLSWQGEQSVPAFLETIKKMTDELGADHVDTLLVRMTLGMAYREAGRFTNALEVLEPVLAARTAKLGVAHPDTLASMNGVATVLVDLGQYERALPIAEEALVLHRAKFTADHPYTLTAGLTAANARAATGKADTAFELHLDTLKRAHDRLGSGAPQTLVTLHQATDASRAAGRYDRIAALNLAQREGRVATFAPDAPESIEAMHQHADAMMERRNLDGAVTLYETTFRLRDARLGATNDATLVTLNRLVWSLLHAGQDAKALPLCEERLRRVTTARKPGHPEIASAQASLGLALTRLDRAAEAEPLLRECLTSRQKSVPNTWPVHSAQSLLGGALLAQQKLPEAATLVLAGYDGLRRMESQMAALDRAFVTDALTRVVALHRAQGDTAKATEAQRQLDARR